MHSYTGPKGTSFHYNSDFSGDVRVVRLHRIDRGEAEIPGEDLLAFVAACYVAPRRIAALEQAGWEDILK